ncbi:Protein with ParB-like nuclease domain in PFGI-1-like cluster [Bathymodiolus heckerae thiotrophic gill symbiont]|nr:Protein with ParB-like nuclease domain in PFGI-1-like cluster [Bathymodiolus heckerae thiotrophic gill symbiont]
MIESGGNTRLQILNELYNETGDEAFNQVQCLFVPWSSESNILTSHLIENEIRGDMILIDKAYAVKSLKEEIEIELGKELSRNEFSTLAADRGYKISRKSLTRLNYAIELDQMIPHVLRANISTRKIDEIKKIYQTYSDYCRDKTDRFDLIFMGIMSEHDNEEFNIKDVRTDLDVQLAAEIEVQSNHIFLEIQARIVNSTACQNTSDAYNSLAQQSGVIYPNNTASIPSTKSQESDTGDSHAAASEQHPEHLAENKATSNQQSNISPAHQTALTPEPEGNDDIDLMGLRGRNYEMVCDFARHFVMDHVIHQSDSGLGFIIECPVEAFDFDGSQRQKETVYLKYIVWWFLFGLSEQNTDPKRFHAWNHLELFTLFHHQERGTNALNDRVKQAPEILNLLAIIIQCPVALTDTGFLKLFRLMENIRKIKKHYPDKQIWDYQE